MCRSQEINELEFAAHARTDLPAAFAHIAWQQERIAELERNYAEIRAASREFLSDQQNTENPITIEKIRFKGRRIKEKDAESGWLRAALRDLIQTATHNAGGLGGNIHGKRIMAQVTESKKALGPAPSVPKASAASCCVHCGGPLSSHCQFARCAGGLTQFTAEPVPAKAAVPEEGVG